MVLVASLTPLLWLVLYLAPPDFTLPARVDPERLSGALREWMSGSTSGGS